MQHCFGEFDMKSWSTHVDIFLQKTPKDKNDARFERFKPEMGFKNGHQEGVFKKFYAMNYDS